MDPSKRALARVRALALNMVVLVRERALVLCCFGFYQRAHQHARGVVRSWVCLLTSKLAVNIVRSYTAVNSVIPNNPLIGP